MSHYVKRTSKRNPAGIAYVGPIRSEAQANREAAVWREAGETAEVLQSTPAVRRDVNRWQRITHAEDASETVWYQGSAMTRAFYRLFHETA